MYVRGPREPSKSVHDGIIRPLFPTQKASLMVKCLHCGAQLALILAQVTQLVPGFPQFKGKRNFVTESSTFIFLVKILPQKRLRILEITLLLRMPGLFSQ